jgi:uncharacterized protein Yka (UPF0111/DUF47 family)
MISLQRIFGHDEKFYDLLESSAQESKHSAELLATFVRNLKGVMSEQSLNDLQQNRRRHKRLNQQITELLCKNFITPLEREDIQALSTALYKIAKNIEKIAERLLICPLNIDKEKFSGQIALLGQAANIVSTMVYSLRKGAHGESIQDSHEQLQGIEGDADKHMNELLRELYNGSIDTREVILLKDIYELLEKVFDRCRDAGNVVFQIALKYS